MIDSDTPIPKLTLRFGETPWDNLPREDLLREVQRMYAALQTAESVMKFSADNSGFWTRGTGFRAMQKTKMALAAVRGKYDSESVYRSFFRYAADLLFSPDIDETWWTACDGGCKVFIGAEGLVGEPCSECASQGREGVRRALEWRDLEPTKEGDAP